MKNSTQIRVIGIIILAICALIDMLPFTSITAFIGIIVLLFRPKWFLRLIEKLYETSP